jgi:hypothetical protein
MVCGIFMTNRRGAGDVFLREVYSIRDKRHTSSADCFGPFAAAAAYDMFADVGLLSEINNHTNSQQRIYLRGLMRYREESG